MGVYARGRFCFSFFGRHAPDQRRNTRAQSGTRSEPAWDHGMTTRRASELILAADISCSGAFSAIGVVREPAFSLTVAVRDLLLHRENPELKPIIIHVLSTRVAGLCSIKGAHIRRALAEFMASRVTLEWKITIPTIGTVRALFLVTRFEKSAQPDLFNLALQLASKPSFDEAQTQEAERPRRACSLLRIF